MTRNTKGILGLLPLSVLVATVTATAAATAAEAPRPNVLMICIDDLNDWVGFLKGHPEAVTPHMDALAKRGRRFANAHCAVPVCSPSRVSVMSGVETTVTSRWLGGRCCTTASVESCPATSIATSAEGEVPGPRSQ
jgi:hypothetical protein